MHASLSDAVKFGALRFCAASLCVYATVAFAEGRLYETLGRGGAYSLWTMLFILGGSFALAPLATTVTRTRFTAIFAAAFLAYAVGWIAAYFTLRDGDEVIYRPTCHYAYHPADDAVLSLHELFGRASVAQKTHHILDENEIVDGIDELGVLLFGHERNAYWFGSQLSIDETRMLAPYQNATGLQVSSAVIAGMVWALENPDSGIVETDEMDFRRCLEVQLPYLGPVNGFYTDWTPLTDRPGLFPEDIDESDPWQFKNVLVR